MTAFLVATTRPAALMVIATLACISCAAGQRERGLHTTSGVSDDDVALELRAQWAGDWNTRVDTAGNDWNRNPCGDFVFSRWADEFLLSCQEPHAAAGEECESRTVWVWARSDQCGDWKRWLLRNHNQHERRDHLVEPDVRVGS